MTKVVVVGWYGAGNVGDELLLETLIDWADGLEVEFTVASIDPAHTRSQHRVASVDCYDLAAMADCISSSDLVMLGGGGLFHSHFGFELPGLYSYRHHDINLFARPLLMAQQMGVPILAWAQGVGPLDTAAARAVVSDLFTAADHVSVRDQTSADLLREIGVQQAIEVAPDPVWAMQLQPATTGAGRAPLRGRRLGVVIRAWPFVEGWEDRFELALRGVLQEDDILEWIPLQQHAVPGRSDSDLDFVRAMMTRFQGVCDQALVPVESAADAINAMASCDGIIAMRLHAAILASRLDKPTLNIEYDPKMKEASAQSGLNQALCLPVDAAEDRWRHAFSRWQEQLTVRGCGISGETLYGMEASALRHREILRFALSQAGRIGPQAWHANRFDWIGAWAGQISQRRLEGREAAWSERLQAKAHELQSLQHRYESEAKDWASFRQHHDSEVRKWTSLLQEHDSEVRKWTSLLQERDSEVRKWTSLLQERESEVREWASLAQQHESKAKELASFMQQQERESANAVAVLEQQLAAMRHEYEEQGLQMERLIGEMETHLRAHEAEGRLLLSEIEGLKARLSEQDGVVAGLREELRHSEGALVEERALSAMRSSELDAILNSKSWRWTRPWRGARRWLGGMSSRGIKRSVADALSRIYGALALGWYEYLFIAYKRSWARVHPGSWSTLDVPARPGLVSVVLPCYNGADMVAEAIDSILSQTYQELELILVNDGSTDGTGAILDGYAARDTRVRVIHQNNLKLPRALSRGFREAQGEFMTWTSADNRMKPRCLEAMVTSLRCRPDIDMVYANIDIIGEDGQVLRGSDWYSNYQSPRGSEHVHLPRDPSELNVWPNNFIGAAFMYRARVARLLGNYSANRFCTEDYDYWMRVNNVFRLRHVGIDEPLYEYRFHSNSLTSRDKELRITENRRRLMCFEDFRRSLLLSPGVWVLESVGVGQEGGRLARELARMLRASGNVVLEPSEVRAMHLAKQWTPMSWVRITSGMETAPPPDVPEGMIRVLVATGANAAVGNDDKGWDWTVLHGARATGSEPTTWACASDVATLVKAIDVLAKERQLGSIESEAEAYQKDEDRDRFDATVVICTYRRSATLPAALRSVAGQTMDKRRFELVVVNNEPSDRYPHQAVRDECEVAFKEYPGHVRIIDCPVPGLSHARNAGISASRGRILLFLDDDAIADADCLERIVESYVQMPEAGVVGGHIVLDPPEPKPEVLAPGREGLWSHFVTGNSSLTATSNWWEYPWGANWSARREVLYAIGGFRSNFGRVGDDFGGGEEIVASRLAEMLGHRVAIEPAARVLHRVEQQRFTERHVERTIIAGTMVNYQMQKSMYLPMEATLSGTLSQVFRDACMVGMQAFGMRRVAADALVARAHRKARVRLLARQLRDRWQRMTYAV